MYINNYTIHTDEMQIETGYNIKYVRYPLLYRFYIIYYLWAMSIFLTNKQLLTYKQFKHNRAIMYWEPISSRFENRP